MVLISNKDTEFCNQNLFAKVREGCCQHRKAITATSICCFILMALLAVGLIIAAAVVSMPSLLAAGLFLLTIAFVGMAMVAIQFASKTGKDLKRDKKLVEEGSGKVV